MAYCFLTNMLMLLLVALWAQGGSPQATTFYPTAKPTLNIFPTPRPTAFPTLTGPSPQPTAVPTNVPTAKPSARPSLKPPTASPTITPTAAPTASPTLAPTLRPTLAKPTGQPSGQPSRQPTRRPTGQPTRQPSRQPTGQPSRKPSGQPSKMPSRQPTAQPSRLPSGQPTRRPSQQPSRQPSGQPTAQPSRRPTGQPSRQPTAQPSRQPSSQPSGQPSRQPTAKPSMQPSRQPTSQPSVQPTAQPSRQPSRQPTGQPSRQPTAPPSRQPSSQPTGQPTRQPSRQPSGQPSRQPTGQPSRQPTGQPTREPTSPTGQPSRQPSRQPTGQPTSGPTRRPTPVVDYIHTRRFQALDASTFSVYTSLWLSTHANWQLFYASSAGSSAPDPPRAGASGCPARSQLQYPVCLGGVPVDGKDGLVLNASYAFESLSGVADSVSCPKILCYGGSDASSVPYRLDCLPTPSDTVEYLPPQPPFSDQNDSTLCLPLDAASVGGAPSVNPWVAPPHYGFNQGVPPLYEPVPVVRLVLKGHIKASVDANTCSVVQGAVVEAWQIDASASAAFDASTVHTIAAATGTPQAGAAFPTVSGASLRGLSCRSQAKSDEQGSYQFNTTVPPSYGPPRHIVVRVSAPGFKPLLTRVYFTNDFRLQQLTTWGSDYTRFDAQNEGPNKFASRPGLKLTSVGNPNGSVWLDSFKETTDAAGADTILADSAIGRDPRVRTAEWVSLATGTGYGFGGNGFPLGLEQGYFVVNFDVTLRPDRASDNPAVSADGSVSTSSALSEMPVAQLDGLWVAADGGLVRVQTQGNLFYASEYPGPRSWGSVLGNVFGNTIRGIDFSQSASPSSSSPAYSSTPFLNVFSRDSVGESVGAVLQQDSFVTAPLQPASASALSIAWSGGATPPGAWSKQSDVEAAGYRFFKLEISRQFSPLPSSSDGAGTVVINEVVLYDGIFSQREVPSRDLKMKSARTPAPLKVSCSSFRSQDQHCFKAFDGVVGSSSAWVSDGLPTSDGVQYQRFGVNRAPLWIVLDLGPGRGALPTALQIVCNAAVAVSSNPSAGGCPRTLNLLGSMDNGHFDLLFHADLSQAQNVSVYGNSSADVPGSATFFMPWESSAGRPNGHQCGSCDQGPNFVCSTDSHDSSCFSRYCSAAGVCSDVPSCALGEYMRQQSSGAGGPDFFCTPCPPGRHGDSSGLTSPSCSGLCLPGYFCPAGSTSPKQRECGSAAFYCPVGSAAPVAAGAGRFTVSVSTIGAEGASSPVGLSVDAGGNQVLARTRTTDVVCPLGHYCRGGMSIPCPVGTYGDRPGLQTPACADSCIAGEYCPSGSVTPTRCPKGYFCPDGLTRAVCPAGTFGAAAGLSSVRCSGLCKQGHFCPEGSTSATQQQCPGGRYGLTAGLPDSSCSGPCPAGYFCPPPSTSASAFGCSKHLSPPLTCNKVPVKDAAGTRMVEVCSRGINEPTVAGPKRNSVVNFAALNSNSSAGDVLNQPILAPQANPLYYCPEGSAFPIEATHGYFTVGGDEGHRQAQAVCDLGYYCVDGVRRSCPAGSFGATSGLTGSVFVRPTATPTQPPGVPSRSPTVVPTRVPTSRPVGAPTGQPSGRPTRNPTGQPTRQPSRQPTGQPSRQPTRQPSARPTRLAMRRSKYPTGQPTRQPSRQPTGQPTRHPARPSLLPTGQPTRSPTRQPSSRPSGQPTSQPSLRPTGRPTVNINGTVDYQSLLSPVFCSGFCARGFFCPANSTSSRQSPCPPGKYGFTTGLASSDCTANCPLGHYCPAGTADPIPCPAGTFGNTTGLIDSTCNGECTEGGCSPALCQEGFYCPSGSVSATEVACGGPGVYCPTGSAAPTVVSVGYHSIGPFPYENSQTRTAQALCPPGSFCEGGVMRPCPVGRYGGTAGLSNASCSGLCREGTYCPLGSWNESTLLCPAGRYGQVKGMWSSACSGECSRGYHCPEGSTSSKELECGVATPAARTDLFFSKTAFEVSGYLGDYGPSTEAPITTGGSAFLAKNASRLILDLPNAVFCPTGSAAPLKVLPGYYSVGGTRTTRWAQQVCPMGSYCVDGVVYDCPAGRYGGGDRLTTSDCTGPCAKGYYCPSASTTKNQEPCPVGRYGNSEGLTDSGCSGACKRPTDCPLASVFATPPATLIDSNVY